jgi:hypothetical protein
MNPLGVNIVELLANPKRASELAQRERAARRGAPGFLGITRLETDQSALFDDASPIGVHPRSAAHVNGHLRSGVVMLGGVSVAGENFTLEEFEERRFPAGTEVGIQYVDLAVGGRRGDPLATFFKIGRWPRTRTWETRPQIAHGRRVMKKDRYKFAAAMLPYLQQALGLPKCGVGNERRTGWFAAYAYLCFLMFVRDNDKTMGVWGRQSNAAEALGVSVRTINDITQQLYWCGVLRRLSYPTRERCSNMYEITWPDPHKPASQPAGVPEPPNISAGNKTGGERLK